MDVEFKKLRYTVRDFLPWNSKVPEKVILDGVSGRFKPGQLTAILGLSGAGKSSLLNALSGYRSKGVRGTLLTNGRPRDERVFRSCSCYITQDDLLQPLLTVQELMVVAAKLKLPSATTITQAEHTVAEVLAKLGLTSCADTYTECLSGGQKKRLAVALELLNNPPVLFLDEPVSGLDNVSAKLCLQTLRTLAHQGRTIVCTIHQPSASLFDLFDHVYVMARGMCVYQGTTAHLVSFLASLGMHCPLSYNPADYVIELTDGECVENVRLMSSAIDNGNLVWKGPSTHATSDDNLDLKLDRTNGTIEEGTETPDSSSLTMAKGKLSDDKVASVGYAVSSWTQFTVILRRMFLQIGRNQTSLCLQLFHHTLCAILVGTVFQGCANDGLHWFVQLKFALGVVVFHTYTWCIVPVLSYPKEIKLVKQEHFNRWYGLPAYYMALTLSTLPVKVALSILFLTIVYIAAGLPFETSRFMIFCLIGILTSVAAEGLGLAIGSTFNVTNGATLGPACIVPLTGLAVYGFGFPKTVPVITRLLMLTSFVRSAFVAMTITVFGLDRQPLGCTDDGGYCHFGDPGVVLRMLDLHHTSVWTEIFLLCALLIVFRVIFAILLRIRLK